jgi:2-C-methyl-D-erythritol 4-phosphate cytidylyltransferase
MEQLARSGETNEESDVFRLQKTARTILRRTQNGKNATQSTMNGIDNAFKTTISHFLISDAVRIVLKAGCFDARRRLM